jgi:hypothetical protein
MAPALCDGNTSARGRPQQPTWPVCSHCSTIGNRANRRAPGCSFPGHGESPQHWACQPAGFLWHSPGGTKHQSRCSSRACPESRCHSVSSALRKARPTPGPCPDKSGARGSRRGRLTVLERRHERGQQVSRGHPTWIGSQKLDQCPQFAWRCAGSDKDSLSSLWKAPTLVSLQPGLSLVSPPQCSTKSSRHAFAPVMAWRLQGDPFSVSDREGGQHGRL